MPEDFLPINAADMKARGWDTPDFLFVCGDAYVDHPSFGHAVISRLLEKHGYRVAMLSQPDWRSADDFKRFGRPRLGVFISSGVLDSMINNYTAAKRKRREDLYSPGGKPGNRPDRALIVYCNRIREAFGDIPLAIGGLEASLRRFAHYDYWQDSVRASILIDTNADLLIYGNGEKAVLEIAALLEKGVPVKSMKHIRGTAYACAFDELPVKLRQDLENNGSDVLMLPSRQEAVQDKRKYAQAFMMQYREQNAYTGKILVQPDGHRIVVQNRLLEPITEEKLDEIYALPYMRRWHPVYDKAGGIPALNEVQFSITSHRGCFGGCSFCAIGYHQGRTIQSRSRQSILNEAQQLTEQEDFKGYIHDVGGPTANFRRPACKKQRERGACQGRECLYPEPCKNLETNHHEYVSLLKDISKLPRVKKVFVRSGVRFDYAMMDKNSTFIEELCKNHVSGQLKVAPEHVSNRVLGYMGKPQHHVYEAFVKRFESINQKLGKKQFLVPYFISGHPGSTLEDAIELALYIKRLGYMPEQVQQFIPVPGTLSTCMYYTGLDPRNLKPVYVPRTEKEQEMQRALLQFNKPANRRIVEEALQKAGRYDLIGYDKDCLVRPSAPQRPDAPKQGQPGKSRKATPKNQLRTESHKTKMNRMGSKSAKPSKARPKAKRKG